METVPAVVGYAIGFSMVLKNRGHSKGTTYVPGDCEGGAGRDDLTQTRQGDGIPTGVSSVWYLRASRGSGGDANKRNETGDGETHVDRLSDELFENCANVLFD